MNILDNIAEKDKEKLITVDLLGRKKKFSFEWNLPITLAELTLVKERYKMELPKEYEAFLLKSNGAIIYNDEEEGGYEILSLESAIKFTLEMNNAGYELKKKWLIFMTTLFSADMLIFDTEKINTKKYIIDGDVGYPVSKWRYINGGFCILMNRMFQCNGAMYWRW
ncbi:MAG: SMI1/KNR4 family protein [Lachnospiraceae bacterium]|nr:SMI1/KNR4 family protein [Lachnospiraceae bacterium]